MFQLAFRRDRIDSFADINGSADDLHVVLSASFAFDSGWSDKQAQPGLAEGVQERVVLEFASYPWTYTIGFKPHIQVASQMVKMVSPRRGLAWILTDPFRLNEILPFDDWLSASIWTSPVASENQLASSLRFFKVLGRPSARRLPGHSIRANRSG